MYLYRAVDSGGNTIDFYLSKSRNIKTAKRFFKKALAVRHSTTPRVVTVDKNPTFLFVLLLYRNVAFKFADGKRFL